VEILQCGPCWYFNKQFVVKFSLIDLKKKIKFMSMGLPAYQ
jgi:hypothetical protein